MWVPSGTDTGVRGDEGPRVGVRFGVQVYAVGAVQRVRASSVRSRESEWVCNGPRGAHGVGTVVLCTSI